MKMKCELEKVEIDDEIVCVPVGAGAEIFHGILKLNETGYEIVQLLEKETTPEQITDILSAKYETDRQTISRYVENTIDLLRDHALIEE